VIGPLRQRNFALLWIGGVISLTGDWLLNIGLPVFVYRLTGSTLATGAMVAAYLLPGLVLGSLAGVFVDRWDRQRTMVVANALLAIGLLPLLLVGSADRLWIVYVVALAESTIALFFRPAQNALLPRLVGEDQLAYANSLTGLGNNLARLVGPPLGGAVAVALGLWGIVLLDGASFVVAGVLIAFIRTGRGPAEGSTTSRPPPASLSWVAVWCDLLAGLELILRDRTLVVLFLMDLTSGIGEGVMGTLFVPFVVRVIRGGALEVGWFMGAQAVGGLLGSLLVARVGRVVVSRRVIGACGLAFGLIDLAIFNYPTFLPALWPGLVLIGVVGLPGAAYLVGWQTRLQAAAPDAYRGRVFGAIGTTVALAGVVGTLLAGGLGDVLGIVPVLNVQGFGYVTAGLLALTLLPRLSRPTGAMATAPEQSRPLDATPEVANAGR
jgi:MFS family permease